MDHHKSCSIIFALTMALSPVIHAAGDGNLQLAAAIGQETSPTPTTPKKDDPKSTAPKTDTSSTQEVADSQPLSPGARIGLIIAGLLALAGGGGGGGGGGGAPTTSE